MKEDLFMNDYIEFNSMHEILSDVIHSDSEIYNSHI